MVKKYSLFKIFTVSAASKRVKEGKYSRLGQKLFLFVNVSTRLGMSFCYPANALDF
jgi:hypothetical protein